MGRDASAPLRPVPRQPAPGGGSVLTPAVSVLANGAVLTGLLVYFGWRRSSIHAQQLGLPEAVFGMTTQDYLLRSVRPVLVLLIGLAVAGVLWVLLDRWLVGRLPTDAGAAPPGSRRSQRLTLWVLRLLSWAWLLLPLTVYLARPLFPAVAYVLFPATIGAGALLLLYTVRLRGLDAEQDAHAPRRRQVMRAAGVLVAGVCTFWTAANYAYVEGVQLARAVHDGVTDLPAVVVHSDRPIGVEGPAAVEEELSTAPDEPPRYRYAGLRFLDHSGGRYFLVTDGWPAEDGVVLVLPADDPGVLVQFVRDPG